MLHDSLWLLPKARLTVGQLRVTLPAKKIAKNRVQNRLNVNHCPAISCDILDTSNESREDASMLPILVHADGGDVEGVYELISDISL
jgi:hypothetical protein